MARVRGLLLLLLQAATPPAVHAQLRPRRVGTTAMGEQVEIPEVPVNTRSAGEGEAAGEGGMADLFAQMAQNPDALAGLANNPMLKGLMDSNPEMAKLMSDPEAMQKQMSQVAEMMNSEEGRALGSKMMQEMQEVLTNPEKLQAGLQQLQENPELKGLADMVPGLKEMMDDPEKMQEQVEKTTELFQKMKDPEAMKEMLAGMGVDGNMLENMMGEGGLNEDVLQKGMEMAQQLLKGAGGEETEALSAMLEKFGGGDPSDLKERLLANVMAGRGGADDGEAPAEIDEEF